MKFNIKTRLTRLCISYKVDESIIKNIESHQFHEEKIDLNKIFDKQKCLGCNIDGDMLRENVMFYLYNFANGNVILSCNEQIIKNLLE